MRIDPFDLSKGTYPFPDFLIGMRMVSAQVNPFFISFQSWPSASSLP